MSQIKDMLLMKIQGLIGKIDMNHIRNSIGSFDFFFFFFLNIVGEAKFLKFTDNIPHIFCLIVNIV